MHSCRVTASYVGAGNVVCAQTGCVTKTLELVLRYSIAKNGDHWKQEIAFIHQV